MSMLHNAVFSPDSGSVPGAASAQGTGETKPKIHGFASGTMEHSGDKWKRPLNRNGTGATHVRTFQGKMTAQGLEFLDRHINDWLDAHPEAEVKFSTTQIGEVATATGKEQVIVVQLWL
ncbi:MAG: hypothetical protein AMXMBFR58_30830 [Phycisphaerae bacterium]|nr:hypothetical protein [Phycisphaerales bacterium]MCK6475598.1 hypothetical protein [Phycisphaerales bacterium]